MDNRWSTVTAWTLACVAVWLPAAETAGASRDRPNILLIVADDLNTDLGCYGHRIVQTPHLDRLARRSMCFHNAYCQSTVCNSSRASIYSGVRSETIGVLDNETPWPATLDGLSYLPAFFHQLGYFTGTVGKNLDHKRVPEQPFWDVEIREWGKYSPTSQVAERAPFYDGATGSKYWAKLLGPDRSTPDGAVARLAARLIEGRAFEPEPFFLAVGFRRPHTPYAAPSHYFDLYDVQDMRLPQVSANYANTIPTAATESSSLYKGTVTPETLLAYYACITYVDAQVGVVIDAVERADLWNSTVVVFISDHGYHTGHHGMWHKDSLFEQTCRVPMLIAAPGIAAGICSRIVELVDLYPTFVELAGAAPPAALDGVSVLSLLDNPEMAWSKPAMTAIGRLDQHDRRTHIGRSVRTARYRYTEWDDARQGRELYDFHADPKGIDNLADDESHATIVADLRALLHDGKP